MIVFPKAKKKKVQEHKQVTLQDSPSKLQTERSSKNQEEMTSESISLKKDYKRRRREYQKAQK
jgi:hypothetical protein